MRDEITRMARQAGATFDHMTWVERDLAPVFERFADLVAAAERDRMCEQFNIPKELAHEKAKGNEAD